MSTEIETIEAEACPHPELQTEYSATHPGEYKYRCTACYKTIVIPISTTVEHGNEGLAGIIGLVFGERWRQRFVQQTS